MNGREKSDRPIVPKKSAKMDYWEFHPWHVESMKGRGLAKEKEEGEALRHAEPAKQVDRTPSRVSKGDNTDAEDLSNALDRIRAAARKDRCCQPYPSERLCVMICGKSPVR
jgi:hypothetical protein